MKWVSVEVVSSNMSDVDNPSSQFKGKVNLSAKYGNNKTRAIASSGRQNSLSLFLDPSLSTLSLHISHHHSPLSSSLTIPLHSLPLSPSLSTLFLSHHPLSLPLSPSLSTLFISLPPSITIPLHSLRLYPFHISSLPPSLAMQIYYDVTKLISNL